MTRSTSPWKSGVAAIVVFATAVGVGARPFLHDDAVATNTIAAEDQSPEVASPKPIELNLNPESVSPAAIGPISIPVPADSVSPSGFDSADLLDDALSDAVQAGVTPVPAVNAPDPFEEANEDAAGRDDVDLVAVSDESQDSEGQTPENAAIEAEGSVCLPLKRCEQRCKQSDPVSTVFRTLFPLLR